MGVLCGKYMSEKENEVTTEIDTNMNDVKRHINHLSILYPTFVTDSPDHDVVASLEIKEEDGTVSIYSG